MKERPFRDNQEKNKEKGDPTVESKLRQLNRLRLKFWLKLQSNWVLINIFDLNSKIIVVTKLIKLCPDLIDEFEIDWKRSKMDKKLLVLIEKVEIQ